MKIEELIALANQAYPDGMIQEAYEAILQHEAGYTPEPTGDPLARFVVVELRSTFDENAGDKAQLAEARRCLKTAVSELHDVIDALDR